MKHLLKIIIVMFFVGPISGCSELQEIEERGFVVGAAYDIVKEKKVNPIMKGTYQMVLPSKLSQQGGQGSGDSENYINVSAKADSVFEQIRIIAKKISRTLFFPHIQVIIFSDELLANPYVLQNTLDVLELGEVYKRHNYKEWRKISKNWDQGQNYFSNAEITVYVHPTIEHSGSALPKKVK